MLVSTTSEVIKKLQEYEAKYGTGVIRSIGTYCAGDRENNYYINCAPNTISPTGKKYKFYYCIQATNNCEVTNTI